MIGRILSIALAISVGWSVSEISAQPARTPSKLTAEQLAAAEQAMNSAINNTVGGLAEQFSVPSDIGGFDHYVCDISHLPSDATLTQVREYLRYDKATLTAIYVSIPRRWVLDLVNNSNLAQKKALAYSLYSIHADPGSSAYDVPNVMNLKFMGNGHFGTDTVFQWKNGFQKLKKLTFIADDTGSHAKLEIFHSSSRYEDKFGKEATLLLHGECQHTSDSTNYDEGLKGVLTK